MANFNDDAGFATVLRGVLARRGIALDERSGTDAAAPVPPGSRASFLRRLSDPSLNLDPVAGSEPIYLQRLVTRLIAAGAPDVSLSRCPRCHQARALVRTDPSGSRICTGCSQDLKRGPCSTCGRWKLLSFGPPDERVCRSCSPNAIPLTACDECGKLSRVTSTRDGRNLCLNCYPKPLRCCAECGTETTKITVIRGQPHCRGCYNRIVRTAIPCPRCGEPRILCYLDPAGQPVCAGCAGMPARFACRRCGSEEHHYGRYCGRCMLEIRTAEMFTRPDDVISEPMRKLRDYLLAQPRPKQIVKWLARGPHADLLRDIAQGRAELTEELFTDADAGKGLWYLRRLLAASGALPWNASTLRRLRAWCDQQVQNLPQEEARVIDRYVRWGLIRRASRDPRTDDIKEGADAHVRQSLTGIIRFLTWLRENDVHLEQLRQRDVDEYTVLHPGQRWLPVFLSWLKSAHAPVEVDYRLPPRGGPEVHVSEAEVDRVIELLFTTPGISERFRFAALLIAIYGQRASTVLELSRDDLANEQVGNRLTICFGKHPVGLPHRLAEIARTHLENRDPGSLWLFPGQIPGAHASALHLSKHLKRFGIPMAQLQAASRFRLAARVPAKVLSDMLDFTPKTFEGYARLASGNWGEYPELRARRSEAGRPRTDRGSG